MTVDPQRGVLVVGHICVDLQPLLSAAPSMVPGDLFATGPLTISSGGSVANTAGALKVLGVPVTVAADVGDDVLGTVVGPLLSQLGLDTSGIRTVPGTTSYSVVVQPPGVDRTFWHHGGVNTSFDGSGVDLAVAARGVTDALAILHIGYPPLLPALVGEDGAPLAALLDRARDAGLATSLDLAVVSGPDNASRAHWQRVLDRVLPHVDICSPSRDDLVSAVGPLDPAGGARGDDAADTEPDVELQRWASWLVERGVAIAVTSGGADGFAVATADAARFASVPLLARLPQHWHTRTFTAPAAPTGDAALATTGAGDAATAGLIAGVLSGRTPEEAIALAADTAVRRIRGSLFEHRVRDDRSPAAAPSDAG